MSAETAIQNVQMRGLTPETHTETEITGQFVTDIPGSHRMTDFPTALYTNNLSNALGLVSATRDLLALWQPGMGELHLKSFAQQTSYLDRYTGIIEK